MACCVPGELRWEGYECDITWVIERMLTFFWKEQPFIHEFINVYDGTHL